MMIMGDRKKMMASILGPDKKSEAPDGDKDAPDELEMLAQELLEAMHARNPKAVADALRACFQCMESAPDAEGSSLSEE